MEATGPEIGTWCSSLSRTDTGNGACELVRVEEIEKLAPSFGDSFQARVERDSVELGMTLSSGSTESRPTMVARRLQVAPFAFPFHAAQ